LLALLSIYVTESRANNTDQHIVPLCATPSSPSCPPCITGYAVARNLCHPHKRNNIDSVYHFYCSRHRPPHESGLVEPSRAFSFVARTGFKHSVHFPAFENATTTFGKVRLCAVLFSDRFRLTSFPAFQLLFDFPMHRGTTYNIAELFTERFLTTERQQGEK
jgi:hypothetical protein